MAEIDDIDRTIQKQFYYTNDNGFWNLLKRWVILSIGSANSSQGWSNEIVAEGGEISLTFDGTITSYNPKGIDLSGKYVTFLLRDGIAKSALLNDYSYNPSTKTISFPVALSTNSLIQFYYQTSA